MATQLTNADLIKAAQDLGCDVAVIRAVDEVESSGRGFDANGELVVRFETHIFKRYTGITVTGSNRAAYLKAAAFNPESALASSSWGRYQIMGFNHGVCGYKTTYDFVEDLKKGEGRHLAAFVAFCKKTKYKGFALNVYLQRLDFDSFKNGYNGLGANGYADKMRAAYSLYREQVLDPVEVVKKKAQTSSIPCCSSCASGCSAPRSTSTTPTSGATSGKLSKKG